MVQHTIKAVIRPGAESGYVAECLEIPVVTQGRTLDEVTRNLQEAVALRLDGEHLAACLGSAASLARRSSASSVGSDSRCTTR